MTITYNNPLLVPGYLSEDDVTARVTVNLAAMRRWAVQYSPHTRILPPESLVEDVTQDLRSAEKNYALE